MLERDPAVEYLQSQGLQMELNGIYDEAHRLFRDARQALENAEPGLATDVQRARIMRDEGFTWVRQGLAALGRHESGASEFDNALDLLERSRNTTGSQIIDFMPEWSAEVRAEVNAEHGATIGLLGRTATVLAVARYNMDEQPESVCYQIAHTYLRHGDNGYYRVRNALAAARHNRLFGSPASTVRWLGHAALALVWTVGHDRSNLSAAISTARNRTWDLRNRDAARASVYLKP